MHESTSDCDGSVEMATHSIAPCRLRQWIAAFLRSAQVPEEEAHLIAAVRLEAALRDPLGFDAFAARSLGHVVERLRTGGLNPRPTIRVVQEGGPLALMDGDGGIGQLVGVRAMQYCLILTEVHGIGLVGVRRSSSLGAMAYYAMMALSRGYIGFAATNTELRIGMPPWGGVTPALGNNPFAVAIPVAEGMPIVVDMSLTATAPQGEQAGMMTHRQALLGGGNVTRAVMGGHKGYALALVLEIICGVLTGASFGLAHAHERIGSFATPPDLGHLFMALNVNRLMPVPLFQVGVATLIQQLRASDLATSVERIYLPGELECRRREVRLQDGIPLPEDAMTTLQAMAKELEMPFDI
jgi:LDH2 family malate/lactate/ureidoglycolate dehydrogenase